MVQKVLQIRTPRHSVLTDSSMIIKVLKFHSRQELIPLFSSRLRHEKVYHGHQYHTHVVGTSAGRVGRPKGDSEDPFQRRQASHLVVFRSIHIHIHCRSRSRERYRYELPSSRSNRKLPMHVRGSSTFYQKHIAFKSLAFEGDSARTRYRAETAVTTVTLRTLLERTTGPQIALSIYRLPIAFVLFNLCPQRTQNRAIFFECNPFIFAGGRSREKEVSMAEDCVPLRKTI